MNKCGVIKLISALISAAIVIGLLYWLSDGFTQHNVKKWGDKLKHDSSATMANVLYVDID